MKKILLLIAVTALAFTFSGCPQPNSDSEIGGKINRPNGSTGMLPKPSLLENGAYVNTTKIVMDAMGSDQTILYTMDGTEPDAGNPAAKRYDHGFPPRMIFDADTPAITVKARSVKSGRISSDVVTGIYTEQSIAMNAKMQSLANQMANELGNYTNPITIKLDATWTIDDVRKQWKDPENPTRELYDGLFHIFDSMSPNRDYILDMENVLKENWLDYDDEDNLVFAIPGISNDAIEYDRPNKTQLVEVKYPAGIEYIGPRAFSGCREYKEIDLSGLSKLQRLAMKAFNGTNPTTLKFDGCTSLKSIGNNCFSGISDITSLDFTSTSLELIGEEAFGFSENLEWIEFPKTLLGIGSYQFSFPISLKYVRHRSLLQPDWGWDLYNYHNGGDAGSSTTVEYDSTHIFEAVDNAYAGKNDHMFVVFIPNSIAWKKFHSGFNWADDDGYYYVGQNVPLGPPISDANVNLAAIPEFFDHLRGDDLLAAQEMYRGLLTHTITGSGLSSDLNGQTVTAVLNGTATGAAAVISGGSFSLALPTPSTTELKSMTPENFQEVTIPYSDPRNKHPFDANSNDRWSFSRNGGRSGLLGYPHITETPANGQNNWTTHTNPVNYAVLTLTLSGGGVLSREFADSRQVDEDLKISSEKRTITYVYVDSDVVARRVMRADITRKHWLRTVSLSLKEGWNLVETQTITNEVTATGPAPAFSSTDPGQTSIWISGGIITGPDDISKRVTTRDTLNYRQIGWVKK